MQSATNGKALSTDKTKGPSLDKLLRDYHRRLAKENTPTFLRNNKYFISDADKRSAMKAQIRRTKKRIRIAQKRTKSQKTPV